MIDTPYEPLSPQEQEAAEINARIEMVQKALRSGKYTQCKRFYRTHDNTFCVLGVVADVCDPLGWDSNNWHYMLYPLEKDRYRLKIDEWLGINGDVSLALARCNNVGVPFSELADALEDYKR